MKMSEGVVRSDVGEGGGGSHSPASPPLSVVNMDSANKMLADSDDLNGEPCETRTRDTLIKSQVLYQLS
jgi:hypothetical protein